MTPTWNEVNPASGQRRGNVEALYAKQRLQAIATRRHAWVPYLALPSEASVTRAHKAG